MAKYPAVQEGKRGNARALQAFWKIWSSEGSPTPSHDHIFVAPLTRLSRVTTKVDATGIRQTSRDKCYRIVTKYESKDSYLYSTM